MSQIVIKCNLDRYSYLDFPTTLVFVPRVGEYIEVVKRSQDKFQYPYPNRLQVKTVTHRENCVEVDVWYDKTSHDHLITMEFSL